MLDAVDILAKAEAKVGITDSDISPSQNLHRLVASLNDTFPTSRAGATALQTMLLMDSVNRLESLKWVEQQPEIAEERIVAPVFLMGLPRSGTTYFQYLFDRDYRFRLIRTWQSILPSPPPGSDPSSIETRRLAFAEIQKNRPHFEGFEALHLYDEDGSDECHAFLEQSYGSVGLHNLCRVPAFFDYVMDEANLVETYQIHKRQLQCLQWRQDPKPWALKYPNHLIAVPEILTVYPDARFVMTHRDPVQALASICKMTLNLRSMRAAEPADPHEVGRDMLHFISRHIERIMAIDSRSEGARIVHVDYYALVADPVKEMRAIHQGLGIDTPTDVAETVAAWHASNPKNARGRNEYTLEQYGLNDAEVLQKFSPYMERFAIPREADGLARFESAAS